LATARPRTWPALTLVQPSASRNQTSLLRRRVSSYFLADSHHSRYSLCCCLRFRCSSTSLCNLSFIVSSSSLVTYRPQPLQEYRLVGESKKRTAPHSGQICSGMAIIARQNLGIKGFLGKKRVRIRKSAHILPQSPSIFRKFSSPSTRGSAPLRVRPSRSAGRGSGSPRRPRAISSRPTRRSSPSRGGPRGT
jgi:hypothetical protein